ncbi:uncharacterized protein LOC133832733 [Humulus lupulus]|uniref:uncharacterized protein LOC133832733 n=1 Tax=Humulus lupulus TaxID=3486 RepID=UPI002B40DD28|nr:uncharacterized protein LOC133832733 [Humulus lupulus]
MTPFQAVYGRSPPRIPTYIRSSSSIQAVDDDLLARDALLRRLKVHLQQAQNRMSQQANKKRQDISFAIEDLVLLKLHTYRQSTVAARLNSKLCRRYFGPFPVIGHAGLVAYKLGLPPTSHIYPVFHVSLLKPFVGPHPVTNYPLPELSHVNQPLLLPAAILAGRVIRHRDSFIKQVLVQWSHCTPEDATWENFTAFCDLYQLTDLEDKVLFEPDGSDSHDPVVLDQQHISTRAKQWIKEAQDPTLEVAQDDTKHDIKPTGEEDSTQENPRTSETVYGAGHEAEQGSMGRGMRKCGSQVG